MTVYTGNNGRLYIARKESSGLSGIVTQQVVSEQGVDVDSIYLLITKTGGGRGATLRALANANRGDTVEFEYISSGEYYEANDKVFIVKRVENIDVRITGNFTLENVTTRGVRDERELVGSDQYLYGKIRNWTLNSSSEVIDTTALGDSTRTYAPSITSGEGSATLLFYEDQFNASVQREKDVYELVDILFPRNVAPLVIMSLAIDASIVEGNNELYKTNFLFNAYVTGASVSVAYGEVVTIDTTFTVDGQLLDVPWKPGVNRL